MHNNNRCIKNIIQYSFTAIAVLSIIFKSLLIIAIGALIAVIIFLYICELWIENLKNGTPENQELYNDIQKQRINEQNYWNI